MKQFSRDLIELKNAFAEGKETTLTFDFDFDNSIVFEQLFHLSDSYKRNDLVLLLLNSDFKKYSKYFIEYNRFSVVMNNLNQLISAKDVKLDLIHSDVNSHTSKIICIAVSFDSKYFATCGNDKTVCVFEIVRNSIGNYEFQKVFGHGLSDNAYCLNFSPDNRYLATVDGSSKITIFDIHDGFRIYRDFSMGQGRVNAVIFSMDSEHVFVGEGGNNGGNISKYHIERNEIVCHERYYQKYVWRLAVSNDGRYLAAATDEKKCKLLSAADLSIVREFSDHGAGLRGVGFSLDSKFVVFTGNDNYLKGFDVDTGDEVIKLFTEGKNMRNPHFINSTTLIAGFWNGTISVFSLKMSVGNSTVNEIGTVGTDISEVWCGCYLPQYKLYFVAGTGNCWKCFKVEFNELELDDLSTFIAMYSQNTQEIGGVLTHLKKFAVKLSTSTIRNLVASGYVANEEEALEIIEDTFDLLGLNEKNGGNMSQLLERIEISETSDDD
eukprot:TRINITY_DN1179_c0_g1_i1.p1 TRINITY_DN1179_c0_g1~~TRINITY_DN1179_c0_g1_i1.p1  ORF type:complete len:504 (+),score=128.11 TRINITY_DN1179_c0_g1_i1:34-1512(+)